jgi:phosphatidylglycerophosphate synthase
MPEPDSGSDTYIYKYLVNPFAEQTCNWFTPNFITTVGIIVSFFLAKNIALNENITTAIFLSAAVYLLDMFDGGLARKCNMGSSFGAKYDLIADFIRVVFIFIGVLIYFNKFNCVSITSLIITGIPLITYIRQLVNKSNNVETTNSVNDFCHNNTMIIGLLSIIIIKMLCNKN